MPNIRINGVYVSMINRFLARCGNTELEKFIKRNLGLIANALDVYHDASYEDSEDLFQDAILIAINTYKTYNKEKGAESTYLQPQLLRLCRCHNRIIRKFSGCQGRKSSDINKLNSSVSSLDVYDNSDIFIDTQQENEIERIDRNLDNNALIKTIKKLVGYHYDPIERRLFDILIDDRKYRIIAADYGISFQRVGAIKNKELAKIRKKIKRRNLHYGETY